MKNKEITFRSENLSLRGQLFLPESFKSAGLPALCLCHGIPARLPEPGDQGYPLLAQSFCDMGLITMIFNFRGAGLSEGNFDMIGWARDLTAAVDYLWELPGVDRSRLLVMGFSGGAAAAVYAAAADARIKALVTCACPASFSMIEAPEGRQSFMQQAREVGIFKDPGFPPSEDEWVEHFREIAPIKWISMISPRPLLIVHGDRDELIPLDHARQLYSRAKAPKELAVIPGAGHRLRLEDRAMDTARGWIKEQAGL